jgi:Bacterial Ig domain
MKRFQWAVLGAAVAVTALTVAPVAVAQTTTTTTTTTPQSDAVNPTGQPIRLKDLIRQSAPPARQGRNPIAVANGVSDEEFQLLASDDTTWIDSNGKLFVIDRPAEQLGRSVGAAPTPARGPFPPAQTFLLHSRPGSQRTIYLDFDGEIISNTDWNVQYPTTFPNGTATGPYDIDGSPATFGPAEQDVIQEVWQRVSEAYSPLDVDVTTEPPPPGALLRDSASDQVFGTRAVITMTTSPAAIVCNRTCGGVAYLSIFNRVNNTTYQPAWVFAQSYYSAQDIAYIVSHEVGHNVGLGHDGTTAGAEYYAGTQKWAPIMGVGYGRPIQQFSKGEYALANNTQDDFVQMGTLGLSLSADEANNSQANATALSSSEVAGLVGDPADTDWFSYTSTGGTRTFLATPASVGPTLDIKMEVISPTGASTIVDPLSAYVSGAVASGLSASYSAVLAPGTYYIKISGTGAGDPLGDGYTSYGSRGRYSVSSVAGSDAVDPTVTVTSPAYGAPLQKPITIGGAASDNVAIDRVELAISNGSGWWNGSGWQSTYTRRVTTVTGAGSQNATWTYGFNPPDEAGSYSISAVAFDSSQRFGFSAASYFVINDITPPTITLSQPVAGGTSSKPVVISGSAADNDKVAAVELSIYGHGEWWNGSAWQTAYTRVLATLGAPGATSTTWTYTFSPPEPAGVFAVFAMVRDPQFLLNFTPSVVFVIPDVVKPVGTISTPTANQVLASPLTFTGTATDDVGVAAVELAIYNGGQWWNGSTWQAAYVRVPATIGAGGTAVNRTWSLDFSQTRRGSSFAVSVVTIDTSGNFTNGAFQYFYLT